MCVVWALFIDRVVQSQWADFCSGLPAHFLYSPPPSQLITVTCPLKTSGRAAVEKIKSNKLAELLLASDPGEQMAFH